MQYELLEIIQKYVMISAVTIVLKETCIDFVKPIIEENL